VARKVVFMFSGQGSHYYGMGREIFETHRVFRESMQTLDAMFQDMGAPSVLGELYRKDRTASGWFDRLRFTHPAIFMIEMSLFRMLQSERLKPDYVLGASLGECAAVVIAGVLKVEEVAQCIVEHVRMVEQCCSPGAMLAVLGSSQLFEAEHMLRENSELAAVNSDQHFVVAGKTHDLSRVGDSLTKAKIAHQKLPVAYAFHSSAMDVVAEPYLRFLKQFTARQPELPLVSCATAGVATAVEPIHLWNVVRSPIRFRDVIHKLEVDQEGWLYVELGPSRTLANFAEHNRARGSRSQCVSMINPFSASSDGLERVKQLYRQNSDGRQHSPSVRSQNMKAYLFPGQGSQARGMGAGLFDQFPEETGQADQILGYSIARLCLEDPERQLNRTQFTQPALFVVNALSYLAKIEAGKNGVGFVAGHSLGEYSALFAAGAFDFETGLRLVQKRASLMAEASDGGMAAVIGLAESTLRAVLEKNGLNEIDLANYNGAGQFIISGPKELVAKAGPAFTAAGAQQYIPLRVGGAFHSRYMEPARCEFEQFLSQFAFKPLAIPVIANVTGQPHEEGKIGNTLARQLTQPVRWDLTVEFLLSQGAEFEEVGPGNVLGKLVDKIRRTTIPPIAVALVPVERSLTARATNGWQSPVPVKTNGHGPSPIAVIDMPMPVYAAATLAEEDICETLDWSPCSLGSASFRRTYGVKYAYACGGMYRAMASEEFVIRAARAGILAFFGSGGLEPARIAEAIRRIQKELPEGEAYGMNLVHSPSRRSVEDGTVEVFLNHGIHNVEASAFMQITPALVWYRLKGLMRGKHGTVEIRNRIVAKVSRPEVAEAFLSPAPEMIVRRLQEEGKVSAEEVQLAAGLAMADDLCVEADSGGHTDQGNLLVLLPTILRLRDRLAENNRSGTRVRVGAAGGIGTPEAAAGAFILGADFILTGSINLCTVEAGMSSVVKDMLEQINVQDTDYAPAGDMFEMGAKIQVMKRGVFFPARAKKLYELYRRYDSLDQIDLATRTLIEQRYFRKSFEEVYRETREYFLEKDPREIEKAEADPKHKMALVFRWYFGHSLRLAMEGHEENRVDFQVHCGPALGAFNQWVKGTPLESWRNRHVDEIGEKLMGEATVYLQRQMVSLREPVPLCA